MQQMRKIGSMSQILDMIPGMGNLKKKIGDVEFDEKELKRIEAIIYSMTKKERRDISVVNGSRRKRIALGSGTRVQDVNKLLKQFAEARKMIKKMKGLQKKKGRGFGLGSLKFPFMK